jgi:hypothetical protein
MKIVSRHGLVACRPTFHPIRDFGDESNARLSAARRFGGEFDISQHELTASEAT